MKNKITKLIGVLSLSLIFGFVTNAQTSGKTSFTLKITNVKNPNATIHIGFYKKDNQFPTQQKHAFAKEFVPGKTGEVSVSWSDIQEGEYAIAIYQDIDNSGRMKTNMFGYPKEPFAFSQNFKPKMSKPKFNQCKINFNASNSNFEVKLIG
jgi:uncharacterized protein (DUF2141 family)